MIRRRLVTLTDAQIKALPTTPITLVAAPAAGFRIRVFATSLNLDASAGAYTNINTVYADLHLKLSTDLNAGGMIFNDDTLTPDLTTVTDFMGSAADKVVDLIVPYAGTPTSSGVQYVVPSLVSRATREATALQIGMTNSSGALTGGNVANIMKVDVWYDVIAS